MKSIIFKLFMALSVVAFTACDKEEGPELDTNSVTAPVISAPVDGTAITLVKATATTTFIAFEYSEAAYNVQMSVDYQLLGTFEQKGARLGIDTTIVFATVNSVDSISIKAKDMNSKIITKTGITGGSVVDVDFVIASKPNTPSAVVVATNSEPITMTVTTYK